MKPIIFSTPIKIYYRPLKNSRILWPILDIGLSYKGTSISSSVQALVDSGANLSILHFQLAQHLGFDFKKFGSPKAGGISASGVYKSWILPNPIDVNIYGYNFSFNFTVIDSPNQIWGCILGQDSIFSVARIDFQKFKNFFELRFRQDLN